MQYFTWVLLLAMRKLWLKKNHSLVVFAWKELRYVFNVKKERLFQITQVLKLCNLDSQK